LKSLENSFVLENHGKPESNFCMNPVTRYSFCVFCCLVVLVRLSVPVQVIDWKDTSPKWPMCWWRR